MMNEATERERLYSDVEVAVKYQCSIWKIGKDRRAGKLGYVDLGGGGRKIRYRESDLREWAKHYVAKRRLKYASDEAAVAECT